MEAWIDWLMAALALPEVGLSTVFFIAFIAATLLPLGSEPAVFALVKLNPEMFWPAILVATVGATLGGALTWWMGYGAERAYELRDAQDRDAAPCAGCNRFGPPRLLVAADRRRSAVRRRGLVAAAVRVLRRLHGDRQVRPLLHATAALIWFFPGQYTH
jgi:hypothetical protein